MGEVQLKQEDRFSNLGSVPWNVTSQIDFGTLFKLRGWLKPPCFYNFNA